jgi:hypothetical protein
MMQEGECDYTMIKSFFETCVPVLSGIEHVDIMNELGLRGKGDIGDEEIMTKCITGLDIVGTVLSFVYGIQACKAQVSCDFYRVECVRRRADKTRRYVPQIPDTRAR